LLVGRINLERAPQAVALLLRICEGGREPEPRLIILGFLAHNLLQQAASLRFVPSLDSLDRFLKV
jgi:hypothetical protein